LFNVESATNAMFVSLTHAVLKNGQSIFPQWDEAPSGVVHVSNSTITNMTGVSWFWPHPTGIVVSSNVFHNSAGFVLFKSDNISIFNNKFVSKEGSDSWLLILFSPERTRIERNSFLDEGIAVDVMTIVVSSGSNVSLSEFNLSNNYWGTINPEQIAAKILDANDDITLGERVKYEPFLTEPHPDTP
jgi:hypothetical protein